jgi:PIN domain nuclease of toxin-antitoxin system
LRLLLDTHAFIWSLTTPKLLSASIRGLLADRKNDVVVSTVNLWEIAIKRATGRRDAPAISAEEAWKLVPETGFRLIEMTAQHAVACETIAVSHGDPFDRLLLAQAKVEGLQLLTRDERLARYDTRVILF